MRRVLSLGGALAALALCVVLAAESAARPAQAAVATMSVDPPSQTIQSTAASVNVSVTLKDAVGVGAWEFGLEYDPSVLELTALNAGTYLSDQGINQQCFRSDYPTQDGLVAVQYGCGGFGQYQEASGDGVLANLTFTPKSTGAVDLVFTKRELATRIGDGLPVESADGIVKVIAPGSGDTDLEPTPTANPVLPHSDCAPRERGRSVHPARQLEATPTSPSGTTQNPSGESGSGSGSASGSGTGSGTATVVAESQGRLRAVKCRVPARATTFQSPAAVQNPASRIRWD